MTDALDWLLGFVEAEQDPERVDAWVTRTATAIKKEVDAVADPELSTLVETAVRDHWLSFLRQLVSERPFHLVPSAEALAVALARRRLGVAVLTKIYRAGQQASWEYAVNIARDLPEELDRAALLIDTWSAASSWIDAAIDESIAIHQSETRSIAQRGDARRYDAVLRCLQGQPTDPGRLSSELDGYPVAGTHRALVVTAEDSHALACVERMANVGKPVLMVRTGGHDAWCWLADPSDTPISPDLQQEADRGHLRISASSSHKGLAGFVTAHEEARLLHVVAKAPGRHTATYDDWALALLASDIGAATRFVRTTLKGLADADAAPLRETVRAFIRSPNGMDGAARALHVHRNTIRYRMTRAEESLGHPLRERLGNLALALEFYEAFMAV